ncbi:hypothetical protein chiPu_0013889, partial [Chiloscyllium punctatum]|nr:hypothetical protein [Chiloscyllium punctatum]
MSMGPGEEGGRERLGGFRRRVPPSPDSARRKRTAAAETERGGRKKNSTGVVPTSAKRSGALRCTILDWSY